MANQKCFTLMIFFFFFFAILELEALSLACAENLCRIRFLRVEFVCGSYIYMCRSEWRCLTNYDVRLQRRVWGLERTCCCTRGHLWREQWWFASTRRYSPWRKQTWTTTTLVFCSTWIWNHSVCVLCNSGYRTIISLITSLALINYTWI